MNINHANELMYQWLQNFSVYCWTRLLFARRNERAHLFETSLTQELVFRFYQLEISAQLPVRIYESTKESVNGNDLEIIFNTPFGYLTFCCQCKILGHNHRYNTINHHSGNTPQIELLLNHSMANNCLPVYLLYNYTDDNIILTRIQRNRNTLIEKFGCSVLDAFYIFSRYFYPSVLKAQKFYHVPGFEDLHTDGWALPFAELSVIANNKEIHQFLSKPGTNILPEHYFNYMNKPVHQFYTELVPPAGWEPLIRGGNIIGKIQQDTINYPRRIYANTPGFAPEYRIMIDLMQPPI